MKVSITYCAQWNYKPQAVSLAAKLEAALSTTVQLIPEGRGIFDVSVDDSLEYSKFDTGTFPNEDELVAKLSAKYASG